LRSMAPGRLSYPHMARVSVAQDEGVVQTVTKLDKMCFKFEFRNFLGRNFSFWLRTPHTHRLDQRGKTHAYRPALYVPSVSSHTPVHGSGCSHSVPAHTSSPPLLPSLPGRTRISAAPPPLPAEPPSRHSRRRKGCLATSRGRWVTTPTTLRSLPPPPPRTRPPPQLRRCQR